MRLAIFSMAAITGMATSKSSWDAKRAARIIRKGSSSKDCSGETGVRNCPLTRSVIP